MEQFERLSPYWESKRGLRRRYRGTPVALKAICDLINHTRNVCTSAGTPTIARILDG